LTMKTLVFVGLAASFALMPGIAEAGSNRGPGMRPPMMHRPMGRPPMARPPMMHRPIARPPMVRPPHMRPPVRNHWGSRHNGRWTGGWKAPGGWGGYHKINRGSHVSRYWISPSFHVGNWGWYGLSQPGYGLGWSRYYDDAVLIDGSGYVYDYRSDVDWDRYDERYDDRDYRDGRDDGVGGALLGGAVGAIAGNRIAGRGHRTEGTLIGAGVGALAGMAIDKAEDRGGDRGRRGPAVPYPYADGGPGYDYGYADDRVTDGSYDGSWSGTWKAPDVYEGTWSGRYEGGAGADYPPPSAHDGPPPVAHRMPPPMVHRGGPSIGYAPQVWTYAAPGVTTVVIQPAVMTTTTTTTTYVTEVAAPRKAWKPKRAWKPRPKCACR
jgi:Ni/Co efflux regulator RcnB